MSTYILYGAAVSYFTGKARAYLRWRGAAFAEEAATREVYRDIIMPSVGWPVIPVMKTPDGAIVQDTAEIIAHVEASTGRSPPAIPETPVQAFAALLLQLYADEWLVLPAMHYRWTYNEDFAYAEFGALSAPQLSPREQYELGRKNGQRFKGALPPLGVTAPTMPGVEASYEALLGELSAHLDQHPYLLGGRACLADFSFIGPLYAHLLRDPKSGELMRRIAPRVADYVERVHAGEGRTGELEAGDNVPETLLPVLQRQMREQLPALIATADKFSVWAGGAGAGANIPRALGEIDISIEGRSGPAQARTFPLWRLQAALDARDAMGGEARSRMDALLDRIGGQELKTFRLPQRIARRNHRLALE